MGKALSAPANAATGTRLGVAQDYTQLLLFKPKLASAIRCSALSADARLLAFSDCKQVSLFELAQDCAGAKRIECTLRASLQLAFGRHLLFSACTDNTIEVFDLKKGEVCARWSNNAQRNSDVVPGLQVQSAGTVRMLAPSAGRWFATCDTNNTTHVYDLDKMALASTLPVFEQHVTALAFHPSKPVLVLACGHELRAFDVQQRKFLDWFAHVGDVLQKHGRVIGITFSPRNDSTTLLCFGHTFLAKIGLGEKPQPAPVQVGPPRLKAANTVAAAGASFALSTQYQPLLALEFLSESELVVVERAWLNISASFPLPFIRKKFAQ